MARPTVAELVLALRVERSRCNWSEAFDEQLIREIKRPLGEDIVRSGGRLKPFGQGAPYEITESSEWMINRSMKP